MALWLVRAGKQGEREEIALEKNIVVIGWDDLGDLSGIGNREELSALLVEVYPNEKPKTLMNWESQIWPFIRVIAAGDLVVLPLKGRSAIAIGEVTGPYKYRAELPPNARHTRPVKWLGEYPRTAFDQDLLYSFGAFMTVCRIQRNDAEARIRAKASGKVEPPSAKQSLDEGVSSDASVPPDIERIARDQISAEIGQRFKGHALTNLVGAVLSAQGYQIRISPEGPDGGVDIIAGRGQLGFEPPRLVVQVKSQDSPVDVKVLRELQGVMSSFGADQGLLVAWGGYKASVPKEAARLFFQIRLWDADDVVRMIQIHYDQLSDAIQAELPLKRIWALVMSED